MTFTRAIGLGSNKIIRLIVHGLALSKIHPNVLTFLGLVINMAAAALLVVTCRIGIVCGAALPPASVRIQRSSDNS